MSGRSGWQSAGRSRRWPPFVLEEDFEELGLRDHWCEDHELRLWTSDGIVKELDLFPAYDESGEHFRWPSAP